MSYLCLLVDDSRVVRRISRDILDPEGFNIAEAENGKQALEYCINNGMPDVILLDWNMPVMNGIEFLEELRKLENGGKPKVIFCTTESDISYISRAMSAGADEYIMKPFDKTILLGKMVYLGLMEEK